MFGRHHPGFSVGLFYGYDPLVGHYSSWSSANPGSHFSAGRSKRRGERRITFAVPRACPSFGGCPARWPFAQLGIDSREHSAGFWCNAWYAVSSFYTIPLARLAYSAGWLLSLSFFQGPVC